jgi:hypothetical protein
VLKGQLEDLRYLPCSLPSTANDDGNNANGKDFHACMSSPEIVLPQLIQPPHYDPQNPALGPALFLREPDIVVDYSLNNLTVVDFSTMSPTQNNSAIAYLGLSKPPSGG